MSDVFVKTYFDGFSIKAVGMVKSVPGSPFSFEIDVSDPRKVAEAIDYLCASQNDDYVVVENGPITLLDVCRVDNNISIIVNKSDDVFSAHYKTAAVLAKAIKEELGYDRTQERKPCFIRKIYNIFVNKPKQE